MIPRRMLLLLPMLLLAAAPAAGKGDVSATLTSRLPAHAAGGTRIRIAWTLSYRDGSGRRRPFAAGGAFVRLIGGCGARHRAFARGHDGRYTTTVRAPAGGIARLELGILSWSDGPNGRHAGEWLLPIRNPPASQSANSGSCHR